jgi:hypothetical protein
MEEATVKEHRYEECQRRRYSSERASLKTNIDRSEMRELVRNGPHLVNIVLKPILHSLGRKKLIEED